MVGAGLSASASTRPASTLTPGLLVPRPDAGIPASAPDRAIADRRQGRSFLRAKSYATATSDRCTDVVHGVSRPAAAVREATASEAEVIDLRTAEPARYRHRAESVEKTGRLVCVDEANPRCSIAADVSAQVAQQAFARR